MKERIKKFRQDHTDELTRIGYYTAGIVLAVVVMKTTYKLNDIKGANIVKQALEAHGEYSYMAMDGITKYTLTKTQV